jgi:hypothetical protein
MDTLHLNTYLHLIEALLQCAKGEEWLLLQQHEQLIDVELIRVMEQVTEQLNAEGNLPAAKFLHYWAAQLTHLLQQNPRTEPATENQSPTYLQLIQTILECEKGDEVAILSQHPDLIDEGLVQAMNQVAAQLAARGSQDTAIYLKHLAAEVNRVLVYSDQGQQQISSPEINSDVESPASQSFSVQENVPAAASPSATSLGQNNNYTNGSIDPLVETTKQPRSDLASKPTISSQQKNHLEELLTNISSRLEQLETSINKHQNRSNPLWYMSILEQAAAQGWIVSSDEIEQLIGTKPHCTSDSNSFVRGCWKFEKAGKVGMHSSWRVTKEIPALSVVGVGLSSNIAVAESNGRLTPTAADNQSLDPASTKQELDLSSPWAEK